MLLMPLVVLECTSRWWIVHNADPLQRARRVLTLDDELGWIARSHLNLMFEGQQLFTDGRGLRIAATPRESTDAPKTLVLGPSSAFGWGVEYEEAWPALIGGNTVLNASQIGYTIVQGQRLYERLHAANLQSVQTVVLAYGVNDIDRFRFFDQQAISDVAYFQQLGKNDFLRGIYASGLLSLLARGFQEASLYFHCGYEQSAVQRVGSEAFAVHLRELILDLRKNNIRVVVVNSAEAIGVEPSDAKAAESDRLYQESSRAATEKQCALSRKLFFEAKQYESWRVVRDIARINLAIKKTADEMGVPVVDIASRFKGVERKSFFVDPIHFSAQGHRIVAEEVKSVLME